MISHCTRQGSNLQPYDPKSHDAAGELCRVSKECVELARVQGDPTIIDIEAPAEALLCHRLALARRLTNQPIANASNPAVTHERTMAASTWPSDRRKGPIVELSIRLDCRAKGGWR